jgi:hypothetical protein
MGWEQRQMRELRQHLPETGGGMSREAIDQLRNHQRQLDADGCMVGVSRQALDEVLDAHDSVFMIQRCADGAAAAPIAVVTNNNQPGWTNIVETGPNVTLPVGMKLFSEGALIAVGAAVANDIWERTPTDTRELQRRIELALSELDSMALGTAYDKWPRDNLIAILRNGVMP